MQDVNDLFVRIFDCQPQQSNFTPGRVNLIGEHIDYNGGTVLPLAMELGIGVSLKPRHDKKVVIYSDQFGHIVERSLNDAAHGHWSDYACGAIIFANKTNLLNGGVDIAIHTNLPTGAGLSSSAALIVGILKLARACSRENLGDTQIALLAQKVENEYIGLPCGIMDQMAVACVKPGQALALDTKSLSYEPLPLPSDYHMAVVHSGQYRRLSDSAYATRKEECDIIKAELGRDDICFISPQDLMSLHKLDESIFRRAKHCMTEHHRTIKAIKALKNSDLLQFGELMNESHISMRDDFEMSTPLIDSIVKKAIEHGAIGARLTGGGFGGSIVACVHKRELSSWSKKLMNTYPQAFFVA